jgi:hypothetical protein
MDDAVAEIKRLYYNTTRATIQDDFARAIDLLKSVASEEERERAAVYMEGLAEMRSEWGLNRRMGSKTTRQQRRPPRSGL